MTGDRKPGVCCWYSLHTDLPEGSQQDSNEVFYPGYRRIAVERAAHVRNSVTGLWELSEVRFPLAGQSHLVPTGGWRVTHFAIGTDAEGPGYVEHMGGLGTLILREGMTPCVINIVLSEQAGPIVAGEEADKAAKPEEGGEDD